MDMKPITVYFILFFTLIASVNALPFRPHDNIDMQGYNVTNVTKTCYADGTCITSSANLGNSTFNQSLTSDLYLNKTDQRYNETAAIAQVNTSSNIGVLGLLFGFNSTTQLFTYFSGIFLNATDQRYNETQRITDLNTTTVSNASAQASLIGGLIASNTTLFSNASSQQSKLDATNSSLDSLILRAGNVTSANNISDWPVNSTLVNYFVRNFFNNGTNTLANITGVQLDAGNLIIVSTYSNGSIQINSSLSSATLCYTNGTGCPAVTPDEANNSGWLNTSGASNITLANSASNISMNTMFIDNANGRVSIGTASSGETFKVVGNTNTTGNASVLGRLNLDPAGEYFTAGVTSGRLDISARGPIRVYADNNNNDADATVSALSVFTNNVPGAATDEIFIVRQNGMVGIKNPSPAYALDVNGSQNITGEIIVSNATGPRLRLEDMSGRTTILRGAAGGVDAVVGTTTAQAFSLMTSNAIRLSLQSGGGVTIGLGTAASPRTFTVNGTTNQTGGLMYFHGTNITLSFSNATNACTGITALVSGAISVTTSCMTGNNSHVLVSNEKTSTTNVGALVITQRHTNGTFVVTSTNASDTSPIYWEIHQTT